MAITEKIYNDQTNTYSIITTQDDITLSIDYMGNLDLYWHLMQEELDEERWLAGKPLSISIRPDDYVYPFIDTLYSDILNCNVWQADANACATTEEFQAEEEECKEANDEIRRDIEYYIVPFNGDTVKWISDDSPENVASCLEISKEDKEYIISVSPRADFGPPYLVRVTKSGSRYGNFYLIFMRMFHQLQCSDSIKVKQLKPVEKQIDRF